MGSDFSAETATNNNGAEPSLKAKSLSCAARGASLGILGGMGPLASAEFLKTIYEYNVGASEQESPTCFLYSNPTFPDRTEAIRNGSEGALFKLLVRALESLFQNGCNRMVIACVTSHYFLPKLPQHLKEKVISLVDLIIEEVLRIKGRHLLLCSNGTREARIFQTHYRWEHVVPYVTLPGEDDQHRVHNLIYQLKGNLISDSATLCLAELLRKYEVGSFIAGCTEIHLLTKCWLRGERPGEDFQAVDPLLILARDLRRFIDG